MYIPRHHKTYLSRAMTRAMAIDHPIGDPHGGPAYGERNEPVSAILAIGSMFATGGAVLAGTATLMQGLMFAGAALSLVGNVTGNKTLSKIGMIAGLAGGVGALAESAGLFASGTMGETFGYGAQPAGAAPGAQLAQTPTAQVNPAADPSSMVQTFPLDTSTSLPVNAGESIVNPAFDGAGGNFAPDTLVNSPLSNSAAPGTPAALAPPVGGGAPTAPLDPLANSVAPGAAAPTAPTAPTAAAPTAPGVGTSATPEMVKIASNNTDPIGSLVQQMGENVDPSYAQNNIRQLSTGERFMNGAMDAGKGLISFANKNPAMANMMAGAVSGGMDMLSGKNKAYINYLESRGELDKAQADKLRYEIDSAERLRTQRNANYANVRPGLRIDPNAVKFSPNSGLIAGQMAPTG